MTHEKYIEQISLWLDNELSPAESAELQTHLAECPACERICQALQGIDQFLHQASTVMKGPQPGFSARFEARLARQNDRRNQMWLGLTVLFLGTLAFAVIGAIAGGAILIGARATMLNVQTLYYFLGELGGVVNQIRAFINLGGLFFKVALLAMSQPLFWGYVIVTMLLTATWFRVMQLLYRRAPVTGNLLLV
ncbi:MAG: zf-HC2 domain-containing protein [Anaerolineae bacterium]|nr:zf-HC2 domain-containing protein [Anaerolineae bacterium]